MKTKLAPISIAFVLLLSFFGAALTPSVGSAIYFPEYIGVDWQSGLAGEVYMPEIEDIDFTDFELGELADIDSLHSTPPVGTWVYDWYVGAISGNPALQLRAVVGNAEVWVANDDALMFAPGDPRNANPLDWNVTDEMCQHIAEEFDSLIYPTCVTYFGAPADRDGTGTIFEAIGWPPFTYDWIETYPYNPQRVIIKIFNIHDTNYYDPTYPYYVVGFYSSLYTQDYYNRNMIHIDNWRYWQRLGPEGYQWYPSHPELNVTRPHVYESTVAHEYQHNIHRDWQPAAESWMNEGCSMFAEQACGYGVESSYFNYYFATPDNSLTVWEDQGPNNVIADYGVVALWAIYLADHYGSDVLRTYVQSGIPGIEGVDNALMANGYSETFLHVYRDWRLANLIRSDFPGCGKYNYISIDLNDPEIIPVRIYEQSGLPIPWTRASEEFGTTMVWGDIFDTGVSTIGPFGSDYIMFNDWTHSGKIHFDGDDVALYGWRMIDGGIWWSGEGNMMDAWLVSDEVYVDPVDPTLTLTTAYDIEDYWDFGFVQVSTDGGMTWTSQENAYTTYIYDTNVPAIIANLPGLTTFNPDWPDWTTMTFDLTAYAGQNVMINFRYMTDQFVNYLGWYIESADVSGTPLVLTPIYPEADFMVTAVWVFEICDRTIYIPLDLWLRDSSETGKILGLRKPSYTILVVSSKTENGFVDYQFKAEKLWSWWCKFGDNFDWD